MKKLNKVFVFVAALFVGVICANAKISLAKNNCTAGSTDPNPQTCPVAFNLTGSSIKKGKTLTIIFYEPNNIKENSITITGANGWTLKKIGETEYKDSISLSSFGTDGVYVQFKYEGNDDIEIGNNIAFANVIYDKEDDGEGCGFTFGMPLCTKIDINDTTYYLGLDSNVLENQAAWNDECTCKKIGDSYVGLDGKQVTNNDPKELVKQCYTCDEVQFDGNTYFVGSNKNILDTKEEMQKECFECKIIDGTYYDKNGAETTEEEYKKQCEKSDEPPICRIEGEKYYGKDGKEISQDEYKKICMCRIENTKDGKVYYNDKNEEISAEEYKNQCEKPVPTGASIPSVMILGGLLAATSIFFVIRNKTKFRKI